MKDVRIVFLDFDGVLNFCGIFEKDFDEENVKNLNVILRRTDAKIVIISSWKVRYTLAEMCIKLGQGGVVGEVLGVAKKDFKEVFDDNVASRSVREYEILMWLKENKDKYNKIDFIILDDMEFYYDKLKDFLVPVDGSKGLTSEDVEKSCKIFGV